MEIRETAVEIGVWEVTASAVVTNMCPAKIVRDWLKAHGFRWHSGEKMWIGPLLSSSEIRDLLHVWGPGYTREDVADA